MMAKQPIGEPLKIAFAMIGVLLGAGAGFIIGRTHSTSVPDLKTISGAIRAASHGELASAHLLPVPHGADIPSGVVPVQVRVGGVANGGKSALIWAVYRNGKFVFFPGSAFDAKGVNLSISLMRTMFAANDAVATNAPGFIWATSGHRSASPDVILFVDPNCIFCHREFDQLKPLVDAGLVVKVVPVAFLKASSMGKAEAILNGGLPAFLENENAFNSTTEEGAVSPMNVPDLARVVQSNTRLLSQLEGGQVATPFMLVRHGDGKDEVWQPHMGLVPGSDLSAMLGKE